MKPSKLSSSSSSSSLVALSKSNMESGTDTVRTFDMGALKTNLPQIGRGLSRCYSGKSRSFACMADVHCVEDLKKQEHHDAKKRKKYADRKDIHSPYLCRGASNSNQYATPYVGV